MIVINDNQKGFTLIELLLLIVVAIGIYLFLPKLTVSGIVNFILVWAIPISVATFGLWWQFQVFVRDEATSAIRHKVALGLCALALLGQALHVLYIGLSPEHELTYVYAVGSSVVVFGSCVLFFIKQALSPVFITFSAAWAAHVYFLLDKLELIPIVQWLINVIFEGISGAGTIFLILVYAYSFFSALYVTVTEPHL